jgi:hypothetical protein
MDQSSFLRWGKKPLLLTFDEAQHALGWDDTKMATIIPIGGFISKAARKSWPSKMKFGRIYLHFITQHITDHQPSRLPFLEEAVEMAVQRLGLNEPSVQDNLQPSNVTKGEFVGVTDNPAALQSA